MPSPYRAETLADRIGADVEYRGQNVRGQHMFANGSVLVTNIFDKPEEAVARFGERIKINDRVLKHSTIYQTGYGHAATGAFYIRDEADAQERHEYGSGYIRRLIEMLKPPIEIPVPRPAHAMETIAPAVEIPAPIDPEPAMAVKPELTVEPAPVAESPAPRKRGRPRKLKPKIESELIDIED